MTLPTARLLSVCCAVEMRQRAYDAWGLIDAVILMPVNGKLEIELRGDLASILSLSEKNKVFSAGEKALQIKMVAGTRSHLYRTRFQYPARSWEIGQIRGSQVP